MASRPWPVPRVAKRRTRRDREIASLKRKNERLESELDSLTCEPVCTSTVLSAPTTYVAGRWGTEWSGNQRAKVRGRLLDLIVITTGTPKDHAALFAGLENQRLDRGARPEPTTTIEWAARWLRDHAIFPGQTATRSPELEAAKRWLEAHSSSA